MGIEIEVKFRISDPEAAREKLLAAGAEATGTVLEENTYFDTPDAHLRRSDSGLRIRTAKKEKGSGAFLDSKKLCNEQNGLPQSKKAPDPFSFSVLTYKGPRREGELKIRAEEEIVINSPDTACAILSALDYRPTVSFQKRRESFRLGLARIELDELPQLGFFMEIEADDEETVQATRHTLGLENTPTITETYAEMVAEHLAEESSKTNRLVFGNQ